MTADELLRLPRGRARYELIDGELRTMTPSGHLHGKVAARVARWLVAFVDDHDLGVAYGAETGFMLRRAPDTVRAPDAALVTKERLATMALSPRGYFPGPPDLAIEVLSPSDVPHDVEQKIADWLAAGCRVVVVLDPERAIGRVHRPAVATQLLAMSDSLQIPELLPGWSVSLGDLFR